MAINFSTGDYIIVNQSFVNRSTELSAITKQVLGYLGDSPAVVQNTGTTPENLAFIKVLTTNKSSPVYHSGNGVTLYFDTDNLLNSSLESSTAFLNDVSTLLAINNTGSMISKGAIVRQTGFDTTEQKPTIALADASSSATAIVLGVTMTDIANGSSGPVLANGSFQANTTGFTLNAEVYLSDTAGEISSSAGTTSVIVGRVLSVGIAGTVSFASQVAINVGSSGGGGGGGDSGIFETVTPRAITSADDGKWLSASSSGTFTLDGISSYPDGFEVKIYYPNGTAGTIAVDPNSADHFEVVHQSSVGSAGQQLECTQSKFLLTVKKTDIANTWVALDPNGGWSFEVIAVILMINELQNPSGMGTSLNLGSDSFTVTCYPVNESTGVSSGSALGSVNELNSYTPGAAQGSVAPVMFEFQNQEASTLTMTADLSRFVLAPRNPPNDNWNAGGGASGDWYFSTNFVIQANETVTFYFDNVPGPNSNIYLRSSDSVPIRNYADAKAAGPV